MSTNGLLSFHRRRLLHDVRVQLLTHLEVEVLRSGVATMEMREGLLHLQSLDGLAHFCDTHYVTLMDRDSSSFCVPESLLRRIFTLRDRHDPPRTTELSV